ncbi:hypothetical protein FACS1894200_10350 [Spirochaetia bacterium]|nr:hypothetical protein FACS1894200_10350 [Spirochaetia bacterium]
MRNNKIVFTGILAVMLVFIGMVMGCSTRSSSTLSAFTVVEGSLTEETLTLEMRDIKALATEKGYYGVDNYTGYDETPESKILRPELMTIAAERGYLFELRNEETSNFRDIVPNAANPEYPQAVLYTFSVIDPNGKQGEWLQIRTSTDMPYSVERSTSPASGARRSIGTIGWFRTEEEAKRYMAEANEKETNPELSYSVEMGWGRTERKMQNITYTAMKSF